MADSIDELLIEGWRGGQYGPGFDPAVFATWFTGGGSAYDTFPEGWTFADVTQSTYTPPEPVLDPVVVTAEKPRESFVAPPVPPSLLSPAVEIVSTLGSSVLAGIGGLLGLLTPTPTAPRALDEAPDPLPELEVTGTRPPKAPTSRPNLGDVPLPPNWNDLVTWGPRTVPGFPIVRIPLWSDDLGSPIPDSERRDTGAPRTPRSDPVDDIVDEVDVVARRPRPVPANPASPYVFGTPLADPFGVPFGDPFDQPSVEPEPSKRPAPVRTPRTVDAPLLFDVPALDPLPDLKWDPFSPTAPEPFADVPVDDPVRLTPRLPSPFPPTFASPLPDDPLALEPEPFEAPLLPRDPCNCTKVDEERKPKKKKKPRTICRKGTYIERSNSLKKLPDVLVNCETGEEFGSERA